MMIRYKPHQKLIQYLALSTIVVVTVAFIAAISGYQGFLSLNVGVDGISLTIDGR